MKKYHSLNAYKNSLPIHKNIMLIDYYAAIESLLYPTKQSMDN